MTEVSGRKTEVSNSWETLMQINSAKDLEAYKKAYALSMRIFQLSKEWPVEARYSLTDQIRRSSRPVCANRREAWSKRRYEAHFISKLSDCDGENSETDTWLDYARDCDYISLTYHEDLSRSADEIGKMLGSMLKNHARFC